MIRQKRTESTIFNLLVVSTRKTNELLSLQTDHQFDNGQQKIKRKPPGYWNNKENVKNFLLTLEEELNLKTYDDWNKITTKLIQLHGGTNLLKEYSLYDLKSIGYPNGTFLKPKKNFGFWKDKNNIHKFLLEMKEKLNLETPNDWNQITQKQIHDIGGSSFLQYYSLFQIKCMGCPEGKLQFIEHKPSGYWENNENVQKFLKTLKEKLNLNTPEDWNRITANQIRENGGSYLLHKFSLFEIKYKGCPEGKLTFIHDSNKKTKGYWNKEENIQKFISNLKENNNLRTKEDCNKIKQKDIQLLGGNYLLNQYSLHEIKSLIFPKEKEYFLNNIKKPSKYWKNKENIQNYLLKLKEKYNLQTINDWNELSSKQIQSFGGHSLLQYYSLYEIKSLACPEGKLIFDKPYKPPKYWENKENLTQFFKDLQNKFSLKTFEDWKRISNNQILSIGGRGLLNTYNTKNEIIKKYFTITKNSNSNLLNYPLKGNLKSSQRWLFLQIQKLFPDEEIIEDYFHSDISRESGFSVQFDVFLNGRNIAFEYHGKQHYEDIPAFFAPVEFYQLRDHEKKVICSKFGIHLIIIPYWWDNSLDSLKHTIITVLPQLESKLQSN